jgi:2-polyprenyl-6-methoxyphenol hydroxylase-like FAD-dependent oxidoreductase
VQIEFTRNGKREFDLVIGADGLHSNVRGLVFGDEARFVRDLGLYLCVYTVPNYLNLDRMEMQYSELAESLRSGVLAVTPKPRHASALRYRPYGLICATESSSSGCSQMSTRTSAGKFRACWK